MQVQEFLLSLVRWKKLEKEFESATSSLFTKGAQATSGLEKERWQLVPNWAAKIYQRRWLSYLQLELSHFELISCS